jgi:hypothetical protein
VKPLDVKAIFALLKSNHGARFRCLKTLKKAHGAWSVFIGGPIRGETSWHKTRANAIGAVQEYYDSKLEGALSAPGWRKYLDRVAELATANRKPRTVRDVIKIAWRRRRWKHIEAHRWMVKSGRRVCTRCVAASKYHGLALSIW